MAMKPIGRIYIHKNGNETDRIGPDNSRNLELGDMRILEELIEEECPISLTCDVRRIQPPYFQEFCYHDMLGGINVTTLSAEIDARMTEKAIKYPTDRKFPIGEVMDKYRLKKTKKKYRKVVFPPGSNSLNLIDQNLLQRIMEDDEWVIKVHPVTNEGMIRDLASIYGYHRLIGPEYSGMDLLDGAEEVATMATSEMFVLARLLGKPVRDFTRYDRGWLCAYYCITRLLDGTDGDIQKINNILAGDLGGHVRFSYGGSRNREVVRNYFSEALKEREKFRMVTNQRLIVADKTLLDWETAK